MGKLEGTLLVWAIQKVSIKDFRSQTLLNILLYILGKQLDIQQKRKNTNQ